MLLYGTWNTVMAEQDVKHFEDLPATDILEYASNPSSFTVTEKLDGSNIIIGRDSTGIYTRRDNKEKYYAVDDYETSFFTNYQKLTLAAVLDAKSYIEEVIALDEEVSAEVIIGSQPNVVVYHANSDKVAIVLFKPYRSEVQNTPFGHTGDVECLGVVNNSFTESVAEVVNLKYSIKTINEYETKLDTSQLDAITIFLCAKQEVAGIELAVHEIIDWPLNKKHPAEFNEPWKDVRPQLKKLREKYRILLRDIKSIMFPLSDKAYTARLNEGYVCTNGKVEFKLVQKDAFLVAKYFVWEFRDLIKLARRNADKITTHVQVDMLKHRYLTLVDKYQADIRETLEVPGLLNMFSIRRTTDVVARDRSAFINAFEELSRIEHEIRRNNRNTGPDIL